MFGGFRTSTPPVTNDGHYVGDDGVVTLQVNNNKFRQINVQARGSSKRMRMKEKKDM